jgi:hypothetical protein
VISYKSFPGVVVQNQSNTIDSIGRLATVRFSPDCGFFWRLSKKTGPEFGSTSTRPDRTVQSFYCLKMKTVKKTGPYGLAL